MKVDELVDTNDLLVKHITGEYVNLSTVEPEDIVFYMRSKNRKKMSVVDLKKFFGEKKEETLISSIDYLKANGYIIVEGEDELTQNIVLQ